MNNSKKLRPKIVLMTVIVAAWCSVLRGQELRISAVSDIIQNWTPQQHLYVKGELGIRGDQLRRLEQWLDENGQHWTVVLMRNTVGEVYRSLDGRRFSGMDAVEWALGQGLPNRTRFSELENAATGETDGAVFILFLDERQFSYYSSVAQDRRQLGRSNWKRGLDREAVRAMRNGGRIVDAVKNTVKLVDGKLQRAIAAEALAAKEAAENEARAKRERAEAMEELKRNVAETEASLVQKVETSASKLRDDFPNADGELTKPPIDDWRARLASAMDDLSEDNLRTTERDTQTVINEINDYLDAYSAHDSISEMIQNVESRAESIGTGPNDVAKPQITKSMALLAEARQSHAEGKKDFAALVRSANDALDVARTTIRTEQERLRVAAARKRLVQKTALGASGLTACGLGIGLLLLNRRRKPAMERAVIALSEREKSVEAEMEKVYGLIERSSEILGSKEKVAARGYSGTTRKLSDRTLEDVDDLLVMSTEVERVMSEARELIAPSSPVGKISNWFSGSRFERGVNRISGESLQYTKAKGLPLVIQRDSEQADNGEIPESISMTFEEVFSAFHERSASASETLDLVESSLLDVNDRLAELQARIHHAGDLDRRLVDAAESDGYFDAPAFFADAIPAAQADYDAADAVSATDPVFALQELIPSGWRKITESLSVAETVDRARAEVFPVLDKYSPQLESLGYDIKWMEQAVFELSGLANDLFQVVANESIEETATTFSYDVTAIGERAEQSYALAERLRDDSGPAIGALQEKVATVREKVATSLGVSGATALHEHERDPDANIAKAKELLAAAIAAINHGGIVAAGRAINVLDEQVAHGHQFADDTLVSLTAFDSNWTSRRSALESVQALLPRHQSLVAENQRAFSPPALVLRAGDPGTPDALATIGSLFTAAKDLLAVVDRTIGDATAVHNQGRVLEAAAMLEVAHSSTDEVDEWLEDISKHCALLESRSQENVAGLTRLVQQTRAMEVQIKDPRTQRPTIARFENAVRDMQSSQNDIAGAKTNRDPFRDATKLNGLVEEFASVDALILGDRNAHAEATRAAHGARSQFQSANSLVRESRADQLPDSSTVQACQREIQSLGDGLGQTERRLEVAHDDWQSVDADAARINAELAVAAGRLRDELEVAQQSVEALKQASQEVFDAGRWTGGFGIRVEGAPGAQELERARRALQSADYAHMLQMSRAAIMSARQAIQMAQREVARQQREAARIAEAARRRRRAVAVRRAAQRAPRAGSWSSHSSSSSSSSSSSGSGFGRSGW